MVDPIIEKFIPLVKGISKTFGKNCEVVLHEFKDLKNSIVAIENGHVTGRDLNSPMTKISLEKVREGTVNEDIINYSEKNIDGRVLKSSTMFIKNDAGNFIGCICINIDITDFIAARNVINDIMRIGEADTEKPSKNKVNIILSDIVKETINEMGRPIIYLSKDEKVTIVKKLDHQGAFLIKGAIDYVAEVLQVSKYTIYNYLDEIKGE
ncbi:MAG TPA: PAS domain-containing protein [Clostridia bacterium]|nr:PAS domain-containing protein [Clostridia bacterium]